MILSEVMHGDEKPNHAGMGEPKVNSYFLPPLLSVLVNRPCSEIIHHYERHLSDVTDGHCPFCRNFVVAILFRGE